MRSTAGGDERLYVRLSVTLHDGLGAGAELIAEGIAVSPMRRSWASEMTMVAPPSGTVGPEPADAGAGCRGDDHPLAVEQTSSGVRSVSVLQALVSPLHPLCPAEG